MIFQAIEHDFSLPYQVLKRPLSHVVCQSASFTLVCVNEKACRLTRFVCLHSPIRAFFHHQSKSNKENFSGGIKTLSYFQL